MADALAQVMAWRARAKQIRKLKSQATSRTKSAPCSLIDFIPVVSPRYERPEHLAPLIEIIERSTREPVRALVSVPPRHSKTETLLHAIAWLLARNPNMSIGYVSYAADIALSKSRLARDYARRSGVEIRNDADSLHEWRTASNGGVLATGVGGPLTGHGVNLLIIDDPVKNRQEAESALIRQRTHDWFTSTATTRVEPNGSIIVCHTRWHDDDLIGRLTKSKEEKWESVQLPAVSEAGEALWPSRWSLAALQERRTAIGEYDWASLFQGTPVPRGGQLFREPARYQDLDLTNARIYIAVDTAASEKTHADFSVAVVLAVRGLGAAMTADVVEVYRVQKEIPALCRDLLELQQKWQAPLAIESVGVGKAVPQILRSINPSLDIRELHGAEMRADKFSRAQPAAAAWNAGRIRVPMQATWLPALLSEIQAFTGISDPHDDQVDALSHAWNEAARSYGTESKYDSPMVLEEGPSAHETAMKKRIEEIERGY